jgi:hypothetical protein
VLPGIAAAYTATAQEAARSHRSSPGAPAGAPLIPALLTFRDLVLDNLPTGPPLLYPAGMSQVAGWSFAGLNW